MTEVRDEARRATNDIVDTFSSDLEQKLRDSRRAVQAGVLAGVLGLLCSTVGALGYPTS